MSNSSGIYLPNLNTVRAFAAIIVVISHIEYEKSFLGMTGSPSLMHWGAFGVNIFFVLSGFLITFLLLNEKDKINTIDVKKFYFRRALRIWPLYFFIIIFIYVLVPYLLPNYYETNTNEFSIKSALLNVFMLTNITFILNLTPSIISTIWSIGIEEQFYLFWPWVIRCKEHIYIKIILFFIFIIPFGKVFLMGMIYLTDIPFLRILSNLISTTRFDSMATGAFFGVLAFRKQIKLNSITINYNFFTSKKTQYLSYILLVSFFLISHFYSSSSHQYFGFVIYPILIGICILNLATNSKSILKLENKFTNYIGIISYGLYLIHKIVIYFLFPILKPLIENYSNIIKNIIIYPITLILTFTISYILYNFYEKRFLSLKKKYSYIKTQ